MNQGFIQRPYALCNESCEMLQFAEKWITEEKKILFTNVPSLDFLIYREISLENKD